MTLVVGIDEVGRGPLAGPVTVGVVACDVLVYKKLKRNRLLPPQGFDSKKLTSIERERYAEVLCDLTKQGKLSYVIAHISHTVIDSKGLTFAIRKAIRQCISKLSLSSEAILYLDGGLKAPEEFIHQQTIIKGDEKEKIIAWASILAKVSRDRLMTKAAKKFPAYGFESHKGYATKQHRETLRQFGLSPVHRKSFCKNLTISH